MSRRNIRKLSRQLSASFDKFWEEAKPLMVNEQVIGPAINPFQELYYKQFGGEPTPEDLAKMDPKSGIAAPKSDKPPKTQSVNAACNDHF